MEESHDECTGNLALQSTEECQQTSGESAKETPIRHDEATARAVLGGKQLWTQDVNHPET
jgi:hypothetical protein